MSLELKLKSLTARVVRALNGYNVIKIEDNVYLIDGEQYTLKDAINKLVINSEVVEQNSALSSNTKTTNFDKIIYIMVEPPFRIISTHRISNDEERLKLIGDALKKGLLLYFADVRSRDGKFYAAQPWLLEWKTVPNDMVQRSKICKKHNVLDYEETKTQEVTESDLKCPYCNKVLNSKFGRTNHVKGKHPEKMAEYTENYG